jgi:hypothetical protein
MLPNPNYPRCIGKRGARIRVEAIGHGGFGYRHKLMDFASQKKPNRCHHLLALLR